MSEVLIEKRDGLGLITLNRPRAKFAQPAPVSAFVAQRDWIDPCYGADTVEEIVYRLRNDGRPEAAAAAADVLSKSPVALKVTLRALRSARKAASLEEALNRECRVSAASLGTHDLVEGIRAQVVDKDRNPRWSPATLAEVTDADVEAYLGELGDRELGLTSAIVTGIRTRSGEERA